MYVGVITMQRLQQLRRGFQGRVSVTRADLALVVVYTWFVAINLGAAWRGDLSVLILILQECCVIGLALIRRPASAVAHWESPQALLGWCGTIAPLFVHPADLAPRPLLWAGAAAQGAGNVLAVAGICDLGRSFGIVAAHRGIQTGGLYQYVRHPIYAAYLLAFGGFVLAHPSLRNGVVLFVWASIQIARIHAEERLLSADPQYIAYTQRVRHRLIPGIW
jgi:protein-S-isoprenylcysteine O-methyltransferase Ste14